MSSHSTQYTKSGPHKHVECRTRYLGLRLHWSCSRFKACVRRHHRHHIFGVFVRACVRVTPIVEVVHVSGHKICVNMYRSLQDGLYIAAVKDK